MRYFNCSRMSPVFLRVVYVADVLIAVLARLPHFERSQGATSIYRHCTHTDLLCVAGTVSLNLLVTLSLHTSPVVQSMGGRPWRSNVGPPFSRISMVKLCSTTRRSGYTTAEHMGDDVQGADDIRGSFACGVLREEKSLGNTERKTVARMT